MIPVSELEYDAHRGCVPAVAELFRILDERLRSHGFGPETTLLHVHNPGLGKNAGLPGAITKLAAEGWRVLIHIHDFLEDFRPQNFAYLSRRLSASELGGDWHAWLYPQGAQIHYAVLTRRDYRALEVAGVPGDRLHLVPNSVSEEPTADEQGGARGLLECKFDVPPHVQYWLYPVRGIRRKNVGELLLYSLLGDGKIVCAVTLAPLNPAELAVYKYWRTVGRRLQVPCLFDVGAPDGLSFSENLQAADRIVTTSVAEGFGLVFLEAWLAGRELVGRDLPEITADFREEGIGLNHLHPQLSVPSRWFNRRELLALWKEAYTAALSWYGRRPNPNDEAILATKYGDEGTDFADLDEQLQAEVIRRLATGEQSGTEVLSLNPWLADLIHSPPDKAIIEQNRRAILQCFGPERGAKRLEEVYRALAAVKQCDDPQPLPGADKLLDFYLRADRFRPIRSSFIRLNYSE